MKNLQDNTLKMQSIIDYISKGWKFRVKNVGEYEYIICYKREQERSLGSYNDKVWKFIEENGGKKPNVNQKEMQYIKQIKKLKEKISHFENLEEQTILVTKKCPYIETWFGFIYCKSLSWDRKPTKIMKIYPQINFKQINPEHVKRKWYVTPHKDLCRTCMMFPKTPSNIIENLVHLTDIIDEIKKDVYSTSNSLSQIKKSAKRRIKDGYECINIQSDGYCNKWYNYKRILDREQKEEIILKNGKSIKVYLDNVKKNPLICASCPLYKIKNKIIIT